MSRQSLIHIPGDPEPSTPTRRFNRRPLDWAPFVIAALALAGQVYMEATHNDRDNTKAIAELRAHRMDDDKRLDRIENKVDEILRALMRP